MYDHVILISLDTLRSDCIVANPLKLWPNKYKVSIKLRTDVLDHLTTSGAFFANCISAAPYTSASHATFLTGKWPLRHGVYELFNRRLRSKTLFHHAKRLGYRTVMKVDFPMMLGDYLGFTDGVDEYFVEDDVAFLNSIERGGPTFSLVHFGGIHVPYGFHNLRFGGQAYIDKVAELEALVANDRQGQTDSVYGLPQWATDETNLAVRYKHALQHLYLRGDYDQLFSLYLEGINHFLSTRFQPFLEELHAKIEDRRYLLVLFGDHGEEYDADSYGHQHTLAEGVLRVPLIFCGTDVPTSLHLDRVRSIDLAPTLLQLLGDPLVGRLRLDGSSLVETIVAKERYLIRPAFAQGYSVENDAYLSFVQRALLLGKKTGSLPHVRHKEVVYDGFFKLTRQKFDYVKSNGAWRLLSCPPRLKLECVDEQYMWRPHTDEVVSQVLLAKLDEYNRLMASTDAGSADVVQVTDLMRKSLQMIDYRI